MQSFVDFPYKSYNLLLLHGLSARSLRCCLRMWIGIGEKWMKTWNFLSVEAE